MKNTIVVSVWFAALLVLGPVEAGAAGFGLYGAVGGDGSARWSDDNGASYGVSTGHRGLGFVFDTAVAQDSVFNYQLNLGYDEFTVKTLSSGANPRLRGLMISNAFGFGIVRMKNYRLWIGPEVRLAWPSGTESGVDYDFFTTGAGPVLGINFNYPDEVSFMVKVGYYYTNYDAKAFFDNTDMRERLFSVTLGILFRSTGDVF